MYSINPYIEFCKVLETMSEQMECMTTQSKVNVALMLAKIKYLWSDLQKLQNYAILGYHCN
jgi:hypothetical protein